MVLTGTALPPAVDAFLHAYGAVVLPVPVEARRPLTRRIAGHFGLHPVSNRTPQARTGHTFGAEGCKTAAYEIHAELGVTDRVPRLIACEPSAGGAGGTGPGCRRRGSRSEHPSRHRPQPSRSRAQSANEVTGIPRARASCG